MRFFLSGLGNTARAWKLINEAVPIADELGFYGVLVPDHYMWQRFGQGGGSENSTLESWVTLTYLAAKTSRLKLGTLVTPIPFRPPGMLAKIVATVDVLSGGRAMLGVGAGWSQTEFDGYSEWNGPKVRVDKTKEGLKLILRLWHEDKVDFDGKFYKAKAAVLDPKPVQKPHPPLIFGSSGQRMMRLAGRHADICFLPRWFQMPFEQGKSIVEEEAKKGGRQGKVAYAKGTPVVREQFDMKLLRQDIEQAADQGCRYYITSFPEAEYVAEMRRFAKEVMPSYTGLE